MKYLYASVAAREKVWAILQSEILWRRIVKLEWKYLNMKVHIHQTGIHNTKLLFSAGDKQTDTN